MIEKLAAFSDSGFFTGASLGLAVAVLLWVLGMIRRYRLRKEINQLSLELHSQLDISTRSTQTLKEKIGSLKKQNRNLREAIHTWQTKPKREQLKELLILQEALASLKARVPGFIQAWEMARQDAEEEVNRANRGLSSLFRKKYERHNSPDQNHPSNPQLPADSGI